MGHVQGFFFPRRQDWAVAEGCEDAFNRRCDGSIHEDIPWGFHGMWHVPSGYVRIAIENDPRNSGFSQL